MCQALFGLYLAGPFGLTWDCSPFFVSFGVTPFCFSCSISYQFSLSIFSFSAHTVRIDFFQFCLWLVVSLVMVSIATYKLMTAMKPFLSFTLIIVKNDLSKLLPIQYVLPRIYHLFFITSSFSYISFLHDNSIFQVSQDRLLDIIILDCFYFQFSSKFYWFFLLGISQIFFLK